MKSFSCFLLICILFLVHNSFAKVLKYESKNPLAKMIYKQWEIEESSHDHRQLKMTDAHPSHPSKQHLSSTSGWLYMNLYSGTTCSEQSNILVQYGFAAYQCFVTETVNGTRYSVMTTCDSGKSFCMLLYPPFHFCIFLANTYTYRYNSTNCDPSTLDLTRTTQLGICATTDDDYYIGDDTVELFCSTSSEYPLPEGEWILDQYVVFLFLSFS
jgi:hypothetical protein